MPKNHRSVFANNGGCFWERNINLLGAVFKYQKYLEEVYDFCLCITDGDSRTG